MVNNIHLQNSSGSIMYVTQISKRDARHHKYQFKFLPEKNKYQFKLYIVAGYGLPVNQSATPTSSLFKGMWYNFNLM